MLPPLAEQIAVDQLDKDLYISKRRPQQTGNALSIAYGGCIVAYAIHAACKTVGQQFHLFSLMGAFLGPTMIDRQVYCRVQHTRDTRTFATRLIMAFQKQDNGTERMCAQMFADFHVQEPALLSYNVSPPPEFTSGPDGRGNALPTSQVFEQSIAKGHITSADAERWTTQFQLAHQHFESLHCTAGVGAQNALGMARDVPTTQDHLPVYDRVNGEWVRSKQSFSTYAENVAALGFLLDGGLSFLPLHLNKMDIPDAGACSTLDFAIRIIVPAVELAAWHLRARKTMAASGGRSYSEQRLWSADGQLVAIANQTGILRLLKSNSPSPTAKL